MIVGFILPLIKYKVLYILSKFMDWYILNLKPCVFFLIWDVLSETKGNHTVDWTQIHFFSSKISISGLTGVIQTAGIEQRNAIGLFRKSLQGQQWLDSTCNCHRDECLHHFLESQLHCFFFRAGAWDQPDQLCTQSCRGSVFSNKNSTICYSKLEALFQSGKRHFLFLCYGENYRRNPFRPWCGQSNREQLLRDTSYKTYCALR